MHKKREMGTVAADAALQTRDGEEHPKSVFVVTQKLDDGTLCPSCFKSFDAAVDLVRREYKYHGIEDLFDEAELREQMFITDGCSTYQIDECEVFG